MKKLQFPIHPVVVFVLAQIAWLSLLGIWIYWYISNYIIFKKVGERISPQIVSKGTNVLALVLGLVLLVAILIGMYLIYIYLNRQRNLTKSYDNFIANVTHELKSPLASIQLYLETMIKRRIDRKRQVEFLSLMIDDARRLRSLIDAILEIAGLEQKGLARRFELIERADPVLRQLLEKSIAQLKIDVDAVRIDGCAECACVIDQSALKIVFDNILENSVKYSAEPVRLNIILSCTSRWLAIEITDWGIGVQGRNQKKIFRKFHRIDREDSPNVKGTGLGLFLVREIIRYHGGRISAKSGGIGLGTTICIELPVYRKNKNRYTKRLLRTTRRREAHEKQK
ncbi:MAG: HAMP domain-containing sensor histidine kinase [candidate division KSB1 bacterium]|jgi:signal transduction histidine kinase|nr:HAMP domain-containing sensor histidine kinase [candidate division KSB1 bacterium]